MSRTWSADPVLPVVPAAAADSSDMAKKPFRETLWFKKGMLDLEQAEAAGADDLHPRAADLLPIEDRYLDDGSVTRDDSNGFSVPTGRTAFVPGIGDESPAEG